MRKHKILIYGAGVIGSVFGGRLAIGGHDVTILARNKRFNELLEHGLVIRNNSTGATEYPSVKVTSELRASDCYDYIIVAMQGTQIESVLPFLKKNSTPNIVFMVNNPTGYTKWEEYVGKERLVTAFPGAGGKLAEGVVCYNIVSGFIQPTTFGEAAGKKTKRTTQLMQLIKNAGFPVAFSKNMDAWQKTHVAMVCPLAQGIYFDGGNSYSTSKNEAAILKIALSLKENFKFIKKSGIGITPGRLKIIQLLPVKVLAKMLKFIYTTRWAESVISNHAIAARGEMKFLTTQLIQLAKEKGYRLSALEEMQQLQK